MKFIFLKVFLTLLVFNSFAQEKTFIREYYYKASEDDSKISSRQKALTEVKKLLIEELGIYVESYVNWERKEENNVLTKDFFTNEIKTLSAGITETKILDESWNGSEYYIKAEIKADPNEVVRRINQTLSIRRSSNVIDSLKLLLSSSNKEIQLHSQELIDLKSQLSEQNKDILKKQTTLNSLNQQLSKAKKDLAIYETQEKQILSEIQVIEEKIKTATRTARENIRIGMTPDEVIKVCGKPRAIDYTPEKTYGEQPHYNYGDVWVLFESGVVAIVLKASVFQGMDAAFYKNYYPSAIIKD